MPSEDEKRILRKQFVISVGDSGAPLRGISCGTNQSGGVFVAIWNDGAVDSDLELNESETERLIVALGKAMSFRTPRQDYTPDQEEAYQKKMGDLADEMMKE